MNLGAYHVKETIDHGTYHHEQVITIPDLTNESLRWLLMESPYCYEGYSTLGYIDGTRRMSNAHLSALRMDLWAGASHRGIGWSAFEVAGRTRREDDPS